MEDLLTLCAICHPETHGIEGDSYQRFLYQQKHYRRIFIVAYGDFPHPCYFCGEVVDGHTVPCNSSAALIHHVDEDRTNNHPTNLVPSHWGCHTSHHSRGKPKNLTAEARAAIAASNRTPQKRESNRKGALARWADPEKRAAIIAAQNKRLPAGACRNCGRVIKNQYGLALHEYVCSDGAYGVPVSKNTRDKISEAQKGENGKKGEKNPRRGKPGYWAGKKHTDKTNAAMSEAQKKRHAANGGHSQATRDKIGKANAKALKGKSHTPAHNAAIRATLLKNPPMLGKTLSEATKKKIAEANQARPIIVCEICGREIRGGIGNLRRHQSSAKCVPVPEAAPEP